MYKDLQAPDKQLRDAIFEGSLEKARQALLNGADVNGGTDPEKSFEPIHIACQRNLRDVVKLLIDHGADVNAISSIKSFPLHYAVLNRADDAAEVLLAHGADPNMQDGHGVHVGYGVVRPDVAVPDVRIVAASTDADARIDDGAVGHVSPLADFGKGAGVDSPPGGVPLWLVAVLLLPAAHHHRVDDARPGHHSGIPEIAVLYLGSRPNAGLWALDQALP